jgi:glycine cleavage system H protein
VSDVYSPVSGRVLEKNAEVEQTPELINTDPYGGGWLVSIEPSGEASGLLSADEYSAFIAEGS